MSRINAIKNALETSKELRDILESSQALRDASEQIKQDIQNKELSIDTALALSSALGTFLSLAKSAISGNLGQVQAVLSLNNSINKVVQDHQNGEVNGNNLQGLIADLFNTAGAFTEGPIGEIASTAAFLITEIQHNTDEMTTPVQDFWNWDNFSSYLEDEILPQMMPAIYIPYSIGDKISDWITGVDRNGTTALQVYDPIVLDLNGNGIETTGIDGWNSAFFDHDGNGIATGTGWVNSNDGILVLDRNKDGTINDGSELFGDNTLLNNGEKAINGFEALADLDTNGDGVIDANDELFSDLKIWRDLNQDGQVNEGELFTLAELDIVSLNLEHQNTNQNLGNGNTLTQIGSYTKTDGSVHQMGDVNLIADHLHSYYTDDIELTDEQANQLNIYGQGRVRDLNQAAALSETLTDLLNQYKLAQTRDEQLALLPAIVAEWAKTDPIFNEEELGNIGFTTIDNNAENFIRVTPGQQSQILNALGSEERQKAAEEITRLSELGIIAILDAFSGTNTEFINILQNPQQVLNTINNIYDDLLQSVYGALLFQTILKPYVEQIGLALTEDDQIILDYSAMNQMIEDTYQKDPVMAFTDLADMLHYQENFEGWNGQAVISSLQHKAWQDGILSDLFSTLGDEILTKLNIQLIQGTELNDIITGSKINSIIYAGSGNDLITDKNGSNYIDAGDGDDTIIGTGNNTLIGGAGNDSITGGGIIIGGTGNDTINLKVYGSVDTLIFNLGDGQDTINSYDPHLKADKVIFGEGITGDMITYRREGNNLIVLVGDQGDQMTFTDYFYANSYQTFNRFEFADGTVWEDIRQRTFTQYYADDYNTITGTGWNDIIYAGSGNDLITDKWGTNYIDAGDGNDTITISSGTVIGGKGNDVITISNYGTTDTLIFNLGDGQDTINSYDPHLKTDKVIFGEGITGDMITYRREGNNLIVLVGDQDDQMTFTDYFYANSYQTFNRFEFADGTVWEDIRQHTFTQTYADNYNNIKGTAWNDVIYAGSGNDLITDTGGSNYIDAGDGDDTIIGTGNNTLIGGAGNDSITGGGIIIGGTGNDTINLKVYGSVDTLIFNLGDGQDTINSYDPHLKADKVIFGEGITGDMITYRREGNNLIVLVGDQGDQMTFTDYFYANSYQTFNRFEFADGTVWEDIRQRTFTQYYADDYNTITGTGWNDIIYAGSGDDSITAKKGTNYIDAGDGNDTITISSGTVIGGKGNDVITISNYGTTDTLIFNLGDGQDTINSYDPHLKADKVIFGEGITGDMITYRREGNNLIVLVGDQGDQMTFTDYFYANSYQTFNRFEFADGMVWEDIRKTSQFTAIQYTIKGDDEDNTITGDTRNNYLAGLDGNDTLYAISGNNALEGGKGDDLLVGGTGQDSYFFSLGDGNDTIMTGNDGIDLIKFRDVIYSDLNDLLRIDNSLILNYGDDDSITIDNYFNGGSVASINFIDQSLTENQITNLVNAMASFAPESGANSDLTPLDNDHPNNGLTLASVV